MKTKQISYDGSNGRWLMSISPDNEIIVTCNGETRTYTIPEPITKIEQENEYPEYVRIDVQDDKISYYLFKFEENNFLVCDIWDDHDEHIDSFACHVFGEDE